MKLCNVCSRILDDNGVCPMTKAPEHLKQCPYSRGDLNCDVLTRFAQERDIISVENDALRARAEQAEAERDLFIHQLAEEIACCPNNEGWCERAKMSEDSTETCRQCWRKWAAAEIDRPKAGEGDNG